MLSEPLAAASDAARDTADRADLGDRAVERRAGARTSRRAPPTIAPPRPSAARAPPCWSAATARPFRSKLFVDLRRAGWPVSPVLEGRIQIGGRSFRLLGIEPVTLPAEVGNAPAIGKADLQSFMTPPGEMLVAPETLSDLKLAEGARPASRWRRDAAAACACSRNWCPACWWSTSASRSGCSKCRISFRAC